MHLEMTNGKAFRFTYDSDDAESLQITLPHGIACIMVHGRDQGRILQEIEKVLRYAWWEDTQSPHGDEAILDGASVAKGRP